MKFNSCCQFCPFTDGAIYTSLPAQVKCTLTDEFHLCDDTHCDVKKKVIPIEWIRKYINSIGGSNKVTWLHKEHLKTMLKDWEKENE